MTEARTDRPPGQPLRTATIGGLAFTVLYVVHCLLQDTGPDGSSTAAVAAYQVTHRGALLARLWIHQARCTMRDQITWANEGPRH